MKLNSPHTRHCQYISTLEEKGTTIMRGIHFKLSEFLYAHSELLINSFYFRNNIQIFIIYIFF
jgi:hypothetical protein